jgi:Fungal specific transcription factor domain
MGELEEFRLPRVNAINRYVNAYISGLNQHIPFLHVPSLNLNDVEMPRLLAMCSLGALYCFEKEHAVRLHIASMKFLHQVLEGKTENDIRESNWVCQTMLLCLLFASWSGDSLLFRKSLTLHSVLANVNPSSVLTTEPPITITNDAKIRRLP